jgi:hypothetical protein
VRVHERASMAENCIKNQKYNAPLSGGEQCAP